MSIRCIYKLSNERRILISLVILFKAKGKQIYVSVNPPIKCVYIYFFNFTTYS